MPTEKNDPAVSNPVHSGPQFEVIYSGSQRGAVELFLQPESSVTGTTWQTTLSVHAKSINNFKVNLRHEWVNHTEL